MESDKKAIILGKKIYGRKETLEYAAKKFNWQNVIIGISAFFAFWALIIGRLTDRKVIYYCIDFYSPKASEGKFDNIFIWASWQMDKFLIKYCDEVWDISARINEGRLEYGNYKSYFNKIIPLSYPPDYFRFEKSIIKKKIAFVGIKPYGLELIDDVVWLRNRPLKELLYELSHCGIGLSLWKNDGNNYYGDPGKTKLYSACGLPVIMTGNTPYAQIIKDNFAGIIIDYNKESLDKAIKEILFNYDFYKRNVKNTWKYINADDIFRSVKVLGC